MGFLPLPLILCESHEDLFSVTVTFQMLQRRGTVVYTCKTEIHSYLAFIIRKIYQRYNKWSTQIFCFIY